MKLTYITDVITVRVFNSNNSYLSSIISSQTHTFTVHTPLSCNDCTSARFLGRFQHFFVFLWGFSRKSHCHPIIRSPRLFGTPEYVPLHIHYMLNYTPLSTGARKPKLLILIKNVFIVYLDIKITVSCTFLQWKVDDFSCPLSKAQLH